MDNNQAPPLPPPSTTGFGAPISSYGVDPYSSPFGSSSFMQPSFGNPYSMGYNNYGGGYNSFGGGMYGSGM